MDFFYGAMSGNSARVAFGLAEAGAKYQPRLLDTRKGENRLPEYLAVNPMGKIPSLVDGALKLWESNAINWYLAERFPQGRLLPSSIEGRAEVHRWLFFQMAHVSPPAVTVFRATHPRVKAFWGAEPEAAAVAAARKELARFLPLLEWRLSDCEWLAGEFSIADIAYAPHLFMLAGGNFDFSPYPRLHAWFDRLQARPARRKVVEMIYGG